MQFSGLSLVLVIIAGVNLVSSIKSGPAPSDYSMAYPLLLSAVSGNSYLHGPSDSAPSAIKGGVKGEDQRITAKGQDLKSSVKSEPTLSAPSYNPGYLTFRPFAYLIARPLHYVPHVLEQHDQYLQAPAAHQPVLATKGGPEQQVSVAEEPTNSKINRIIGSVDRLATAALSRMAFSSYRVEKEEILEPSTPAPPGPVQQQIQVQDTAQEIEQQHQTQIQEESKSLGKGKILEQKQVQSSSRDLASIQHTGTRAKDLSPVQQIESKSRDISSVQQTENKSKDLATIQQTETKSKELPPIRQADTKVLQQIPQKEVKSGELNSPAPILHEVSREQEAPVRPRELLGQEPLREQNLHKGELSQPLQREDTKASELTIPPYREDQRELIQSSTQEGNVREVLPEHQKDALDERQLPQTQKEDELKELPLHQQGIAQPSELPLQAKQQEELRSTEEASNQSEELKEPELAPQHQELKEIQFNDWAVRKPQRLSRPITNQFGRSN